MTAPVRVIVADDHPLFREGVVTSLRSQADIEVVGEAASADDALSLARAQKPDIALLDVHMPGNGITAATRILQAYPSMKVIMLTVSEEDDNLLAALKVGVKGYVLKGVAAAELAQVVRRVAAGEVHVAPTLAWVMLHEMSRPRPADPLAELTSREREVLEAVGSGLSNQEIGLRLGLSEKTVKHYMGGVLAKLQLRSRTEAALLAARVGLTSADTSITPPTKV